MTGRDDKREDERRKPAERWISPEDLGRRRRAQVRGTCRGRLVARGGPGYARERRPSGIRRFGGRSGRPKRCSRGSSARPPPSTLLFEQHGDAPTGYTNHRAVTISERTEPIGLSDGRRSVRLKMSPRRIHKPIFAISITDCSLIVPGRRALTSRLFFVRYRSVSPPRPRELGLALIRSVGE